MELNELDEVTRIVDLKASASDARKDIEDKFVRFWEIFNSILDSNDAYPWRSKVFINETFKVIDTILPIYTDMLFSKGDSFKVKGIDRAVDQTQAKIIESLISVYLDKMDFYLDMVDFVTELLIYGTAFGKMYWRKETKDYKATKIVEKTKTKKIMGLEVPVGKEYEEEEVIKEKIITDSPIFEHISYKDIFFSARASKLDQSWIIHRTWKTIEQLKDKNRRYKDLTGKNYYKNLMDLESYNSVGREHDRQEQDTKNQKSSIGYNYTSETAKEEDPILSKNPEGEVEILEYWSKDGKEVKVVAGGKVLIRESYNPFDHQKKPFIYANYIRRPKEILGIGICELTEDSQDFLNTSVNQAIDSNSLANNLMLLVSRDSDFNPDQAKARPGGYVYATTEPGESVTNKISQLKFSKVDTTSEVAMALNDIRETTGANQFMQGNYTSGAVRNTSQQRMLMAAGSKKFIGKILTFEHMFLKPFVRMFYSLIRQFMTSDQVVKILGKRGEQFVNVTSDDIVEDIDFQPVGSKQLVELEQLTHQLNQFLAITSRIPSAQAVVRFKELIREIANVMFDDPAIADRILYSEEETAQLMQQMMQAQQQQKQQGGAQTEIRTTQQPSQGNPQGGAR